MDKPQSRLIALLIGLMAAAGVGVAAFALVTLLWPQGAFDEQRAQAIVSSPAGAPQVQGPALTADGKAAAGETVAAITPPPASKSIMPVSIPEQPPETATRLEAIAISRTGTRPGGASERRFKNGIGDAGPDSPGGRGLVILQLGDSHTAADFMTGELRKRLQARYGNGGAGYITAGRPHIGVRTSALKVGISPGWTYRAIQKSDAVVSEFWLSGFNAITSAAGESLSFTAENPITFDSIEIEALRQPGGGTIEISMDGKVKSTFELTANTVEPLVLRVTPEGAPTDQVRQIEIKTQSAGPVAIASVAVFNKRSGVSYNAIGYPGATIDILNKFDRALMADDLRRLNPQIVVLAFGTNEASNKSLDATRYAQKYEQVIDRIKAVLPNVAIVIVAPPDGAERPSSCSGKPATELACRPVTTELAPSASPPKADCDWHTLPKLDMIREVERKIAERRGLTYWNWASIMPQECGANRWVAASPPLMTPDHIHFTIAGYTKTAEQFMNTLVPLIEKLQIKPITAANN
jgi:lysophospholipase L1-like esterase